jgi:FkbM family methyltransferase
VRTVDVTSLDREFQAVDPLEYPYAPDTFEDEVPVKRDYWARWGHDHALIDIGAGFGGYALPALANGASVWAIDPTEDSSLILKESVAANGWARQFKFSRFALWNNASEFPDWMESDVFRRFPTGGSPFLSTLDMLAGSLLKLDAIKIDVVGAELGVVQGAFETLQRYKPFLLIEDYAGLVDHATEETRKKLLNILMRLGYRYKWGHYEGDREERRFIIAEAEG